MPRKVRTAVLALCAVVTLIGAFLLGGELLHKDNPKVHGPQATVTPANWTDNLKINADGSRTVLHPHIKRERIEPGDNVDVQYAKSALNNQVVGSPFFECPDGRNNRADWTWVTAHKLRPCVNGSIHFQMDANGKLTVLSSTDSHYQTASTIWGDKDKAWDRSTAGWNLISQKKVQSEPISETKYHEVTYHILGYTYNPQFERFGAYAKRPGGSWTWVSNLDDQSWKAGEPVEFVILWQDPAKRLVDAKVPFNWEVTEATY